MKKASMKAKNGQRGAMRLLQSLRKQDWDGLQASRNSAELVSKTLFDVATWPVRERNEFSRIIADWLVTHLKGCGYNFDTYSRHYLRKPNTRAAAI